MLRGHQPEIEHDDDQIAQRVDVLRRKVAWQVATAYGLPLEDVRVPEPSPSPEPEAEPAAARRVPTLPELERRVAAASPNHPELAEEWRWYLFYLRDFAHTDGSLDDDFGLLVDTAFGPLLAAA